MPRGQVKSFSITKGYGFIADGEESYFFHASDLPKEIAATDVKRGDVFSFDDVPAPKGMQAKKLVKIEQATAPQLCDGPIVRRESAPKHGTVVLSVHAKSPFYKDPQECRDALIAGAKRSGCNAVLGLTVQRETWSSGNYRHTMHWADGYLCVVVESRPCEAMDKSSLEDQLEQLLANTKQKATTVVEEFDSKRFWQKFPWGLIIVAAVILGILLVNL